MSEGEEENRSYPGMRVDSLGKASLFLTALIICPYCVLRGVFLFGIKDRGIKVVQEKSLLSGKATIQP